MMQRHRLLGVLALVLAGLAFSLGTSSAGADQGKQRLVVRGDSTIVDGPSGAGTMKLRIAQAFPNGEGGVCAPIDGSIVLGADTPNRLVLTVDGESCQDGAGPG